VLDAARTVVNALNDLYVEIDTAIRAINVAAVEKATALAVLHRDQSVPRAAARAETHDVGEQVEALEGEIAAAEQAQQLIRNQINVNVLNNLTLQFGDLTVTIQKLKASLASVNISFRMKELFSGMIEVGGERLAEALAEVKQAAASFGKAKEGVADVTEALEKLLAPLARVAEGGERLVRTVRTAWRKLFGPREPLPWPTGLRLLPPEGTDNEPRDVELVELRRFEGVEGITFGLAPLSGGQFVSGGEDKTLRLWSVTEPTSLAELQAHDDWIVRIAALNRDRVVTASRDATLVLWDIIARAPIRRIAGDTEPLRDVAALDVEHFLSVSRRSGCRLWHSKKEQA